MGKINWFLTKEIPHIGKHGQNYNLEIVKVPSQNHIWYRQVSEESVFEKKEL